MIRTALLLLVMLSWSASTQGSDELSVLPKQVDGVAPTRMMHRYLMNKTYEALDRRGAAYEELKKPEQIVAYQKKMHDFFVEKLGGFPERTPLNARTVGTIQKDGYRIAKVIYESRPQHFVTALLYLPDIKPPYPGVLVPCGHSRTGKQYEGYQKACILMAENGMAVLCYDPIDQGERIQLLKADGTPVVWGTGAHGRIGKGSMLLGRNTATFRVWDGMRSLDYLASRKEVDPDRLGCTGNSGGGTMTSYLMALDPRIKCAAPACYLTSLRRLMETGGPQDAEQNIHAQIDFGMDHPEYLIMRTPKPTLMCTATRDFFSITGAWNTFRDAKRIYTRLGFPERVDLVETDEKHGFSIRLREGAVRWMRRWLLGSDDTITEPDLTDDLLSVEEANCTPKGQVAYLPGAKTTYDINNEYEAELAKERRAFWTNTDPAKAMAEVRRVTGIRRLDDLPKPKVEMLGQIQREGYRIDRLILKPEPGIWLPALLFVPEKPKAEAYLFLDDRGKTNAAAPGGDVEELAKAGHLVLAVDVRSTGETMPVNKGYSKGDIRDEAAIAYLLGTSYVKMQAEDMLVCARFLAGHESPDARRPVRVVASGMLGTAALHAAALEPDAIDHLTLREALYSWDDVVHKPGNKKWEYVELVHGALLVYDLPDLVRSLGGRVELCDPRGADGRAVGEHYIQCVRRFADRVLADGRDKYGKQHTPLFVDGLHSQTLQPVKWRRQQETWILSNYASQQSLMRTLDGLTAVTGDQQYRRAAEDATRWALEHLRTPNGLLYWGGHVAWDLEEDKPAVAQGPYHELKYHQPYFHLMWRVAPERTTELMKAVWAAHILDWSLLDYDRHGTIRQQRRVQWDHPFREDVEVPFPMVGRNISFLNTTIPLMHSGVTLAVLNKDRDALKWTRRLVNRWQQGKHPQTGLCGYRLSYQTKEKDRAQIALKHIHPDIREATYVDRCRYRSLPLVQMQAAETLMKNNGPCAEVGREFMKWASDDLKAFQKYSYDRKTGKCKTLLIDGTPIRWKEARRGYLSPAKFAPREPDGCFLWAYSMAYRMTNDQTHWRMARDLAQQFGLGELGRPSGDGRRLNLDTDHRDWPVIYALLELNEATGDEQFLRLACRVADNLLDLQTAAGLFPRPGRHYARTGDEIPLALLHLAAAIEDKRDALPPAAFDNQYFHAYYAGDPEKQKRGRTYDSRVFYGDR